MKRLFILILSFSILLCGCGFTARQHAKAPLREAPAVDETQLLADIASEVALAMGYGKFEDVEKYMLWDHATQMALLFPGQSAPYAYGGFTFADQAAVLDAVRAELISSEEPEFRVIVTDAVVQFHPDGTAPGCFGDIPEQAFPLDAIAYQRSATVTVSLALENGEETGGTMKIHFVWVDGQWKVYSPTVGAFFLALYKPASHTPA